MIVLLPPTAVLVEQTVVELLVHLGVSPGDYEDQTTREDAVIESDQVAELECIRFHSFPILLLFHSNPCSLKLSQWSFCDSSTGDFGCYHCPSSGFFVREEDRCKLLQIHLVHH